MEAQKPACGAGQSRRRPGCHPQQPVQGAGQQPLEQLGKNGQDLMQAASFPLDPLPTEHQSEKTKRAP